MPTKRRLKKGRKSHSAMPTSALWKQLERFQALSMRMAGYLHQVKTPLHVIQSQVELLLDSPKFSVEDKASLQMIMQNAERLGAQTRSLLDLARGTQQVLRPESLSPLLDEICHAVQADCRKKNITFEKNLTTEAAVLMDAVTLHGALHNLVNNAIEALPVGGALRIRASDDAARGHVVVQIEDSGPGMSPKALEKLQTPFQTSKADGTGLGVYIARHIFKQHKASMKYASVVGKGTTVTVDFPVAKAA